LPDITIKIVPIFIGLCFAYFGYSLFRRGVFERAGDLRAAWGERHLVLKQAAPGTFFALFGALVISASVWRGVEIKIDRVREPIVPPTAYTTPSPNPQTKQQSLTSSPQQWTTTGEALPDIPTPEVSFFARRPLTLIEKLLAGQKLTDAEIKELRVWLTREQERMRFIGIVPPGMMPPGMTNERMRVGPGAWSG
jgi:hypothetical protein